MIRGMLGMALSLCVGWSGGDAVAEPAQADHLAELETAFETCMSWEGDEEQTLAYLRRLGFKETSNVLVENGFVFEATHWLTSPKGAVTIEIFYGQIAPHCVVQSNTVGAQTVVTVIRQHLEAYHLDVFRERGAGIAPYGDQLLCPSFIEADETHPLPFEIMVLPPDHATACDDTPGAEIIADRLV